MSGTAFTGGMWRLALLFVAALASVFFIPGSAPEAQTARKPNILFILTDDQDPKSLRKMANVQRLLVDRGTNFTHAFATTPVCCPSRVSFMRGQYVHNHGVRTDAGTLQSGYSRFIELGLQDSTVATWLHDDAGYSTFYAGKFLNGYSRTTYVPPGWDGWYAFSGQAQQDYTVNENGTLKTYTQDQQRQSSEAPTTTRRCQSPEATTRPTSPTSPRGYKGAHSWTTIARRTTAFMPAISRWSKIGASARRASRAST